MNATPRICNFVRAVHIFFTRCCYGPAPQTLGKQHMRKQLSVRSTRRLSFVAGAIVGIFSSASAMADTPLSRGPDPLFHDKFEGMATGPFNDSDASRFLTQATFGPTDTDIAYLRQKGYTGWLTEQFSSTTTPPTYEVDYMTWVEGLGEQLGEENRQEAWFLGALGGPDPKNNALIHKDQLRQRVAFALSEIFVTSQENSNLYGYPKGLAYYYDILTRDAFGNFRDLLQDVTLSPAMGVYLNMMGNRRADSTQNLHPDENYGREINQLFSVGLVMLNVDGTPQLSGGQPIPTYTQATVTAFASVFTSWNWPGLQHRRNVRRLQLLLSAIRQLSAGFRNADDSVRNHRFSDAKQHRLSRRRYSHRRSGHQETVRLRPGRSRRGAERAIGRDGS